MISGSGFPGAVYDFLLFPFPFFLKILDNGLPLLFHPGDATFKNGQLPFGGLLFLFQIIQFLLNPVPPAGHPLLHGFADQDKQDHEKDSEIDGAQYQVHDPGGGFPTGRAVAARGFASLTAGGGVNQPDL